MINSELRIPDFLHCVRVALQPEYKNVLRNRSDGNVVTVSLCLMVLNICCLQILRFGGFGERSNMANATERIGIYQCGIRAEQQGWLFREQPINDIGIDAHIEYVVGGEPRQLLALQIKSGPSWFSRVSGGCVIFRDISQRQYLYWTRNALPCVLVLYNPETEECVWQELSADTIKKVGKGYRVDVPLMQVFLDKGSHKLLLNLNNLPPHALNYNFLQSQKYFMRVIERGGVVKLHAKEWVNKTSGRGTIRLLVDEGDDGNSREYIYPYWFPSTSYSDVFGRLFPWADFTVDHDFYEDDDLQLWYQYECSYDGESGEWLQVGDSFEEFRSVLDSLNPMRSIDHGGELAEFMLHLQLNDLGRSFLAVDDYLMEESLYSKARPKVMGEGGEGFE